jgi:hypothetical protein
MSNLSRIRVIEIYDDFYRVNSTKFNHYPSPQEIEEAFNANEPATITLPITEYEQLMAIKKAACVYVREEVNWEEHGIHEEGGDEKAMEWFVNEYSEHNYG